MPIYVQNNHQYGGNLINQKYAPLAVNAVRIEESRAEYTALFDRRIDLLRERGLFPQRLNFQTADWQLIQENEMAADARRPIVVVSSNRAEWIRAGYERINDGDCQSVNDPDGLAPGPSPWYLPKRINDPNRHVYVIVHQYEFNHYLECMHGTGMTVVGWSFDPGGDDGVSYAGFGASRYAAVEFCKHIFNMEVENAVPRRITVPIPNQKAWLVDDNVIFVRGFPEFADAENVLNNDVWGLGFTGATENSEDRVFWDLITQLSRGIIRPANVGAVISDGILQQCVVLNIGQLNAQFLNYSPYFFNSNEDTSFSNFLQKQAPSRLRICTGATVLKGVPENDEEHDGSIALADMRMAIRDAIYESERVQQVTSLPLDGRPGRAWNMGDYVNEVILPNAMGDFQNEAPGITQAKAIEQLMAKVSADYINWVPPRIFRPNGNVRQVVGHI